MAQHFEYLLIGGGVAAAHALDTLIKEGIPGSSIALLSSEEELPYNRPPLSKGYLLGKESRESVFVRQAHFYQEKGVRLFLGARAITLKEQDHTVTLEEGEILSFSKLLIATGCTPRTLNIPGSTLQHIITLRTLKDTDDIRAAIKPGGHAVIVGGGFIGLEIASTLSQRGMNVTLLHRGNALGDRLGSPDISSFFLQEFRAHNIDVRFETEAARFGGSDAVTDVVTTKNETLPADLVVVGIGVAPETGFVSNTGITVENGIRVNEYMETSMPNIYAAGDVTSFFDPLYGKQRHIEHWATAIEHGKIAGMNMAGKRVPYGAVSYFFSDLFDFSYDYFGDAEGTDHIAQRGSFEEKSVTLFFLKEGVVRAAFMMGRPKERKQTIGLIQKRVPIDPATLEQTATPLPSP